MNKYIGIIFTCKVIKPFVSVGIPYITRGRFDISDRICLYTILDDGRIRIIDDTAGYFGEIENTEKAKDCLHTLGKSEKTLQYFNMVYSVIQGMDENNKFD